MTKLLLTQNLILLYTYCSTPSGKFTCTNCFTFATSFSGTERDPDVLLSKDVLLLENKFIINERER